MCLPHICTSIKSTGRYVFPQTVYCWGSQCCLKCVRLGWGAVSASQSLSPVSQFVSHLALSFTLAGVLCPPRWACLRSCLPICFPSGFVFDLGWGAVSASLGLSPNLSPIWLCLSAWLGLSAVLSPNLSPTWLCLSPWLGCCVRLIGLVSQFASQFVSHLALSSSFVSPFAPHLALSFTLAGVLCPPRWACLPIFLPSGFVSQFCLPICFASGFVFHLGWGAVSASLGLSSVLSPNLSAIWLCLPVFPQTVYCWGSQCCLKCVRLGWDAVSASLVSSSSCLRSCLPTCLPSWLGCCVRLPGLVFLWSPVLSPNLSPV